MSGKRILEAIRLTILEITINPINPSARGRLPSCDLLTWTAPEAPQIIKAIDIIVACIPELDGPTLLLKTPHVLAATAGHGEMKLGLNWKRPPCWLAFTVPKEQWRLLEANCN